MEIFEWKSFLTGCSTFVDSRCAHNLFQRMPSFTLCFIPVHSLVVDARISTFCIDDSVSIMVSVSRCNVISFPQGLDVVWIQIEGVEHIVVPHEIPEWYYQGIMLWCETFTGVGTELKSEVTYLQCAKIDTGWLPCACRLWACHQKDNAGTPICQPSLCPQDLASHHLGAVVALPRHVKVLSC